MKLPKLKVTKKKKNLKSRSQKKWNKIEKK